MYRKNNCDSIASIAVLIILFDLDKLGYLVPREVVYPAQ